MAKNKLNEDEIIDFVRKNFKTKNKNIIKTIGDDTSVTALTTKKNICQLSTTDTMVEGVHFDLKWMTPFKLGKKLITVSVSDIASMLGDPKYCLISLSLTKNTSLDFIKELYRGIKKALKDYNLELIGGNTTATHGSLTLTSTVLGEAEKSQIAFRNGAKEGDIVFVTDTLGSSYLGLTILLKKNKKNLNFYPKNAVKKHIEPTARLNIAKELRKQKIVTSMTDISDSLLTDLSHIAKESSLKGIINLEKLPLSGELQKLVKKDSFYYNYPLVSGEEYELLFTINEKNREKIQKISKKLKIKITEIGKMQKGQGVTVTDDHGKDFKVTEKIFSHF